MIRRTLSALAIAASLVPFSPAIGTAHAEAAPQHSQVPGYYRMALGELEVTALYDGYVDLDAKLLLGASKAEVQRLLASKFLAGEKVQTAVNAYLINAGGKLILVDAGAAKAFGPTLGFIGEQIRAAGYSPDKVDVVLLTHLHADHVAGLLDAAGQPLFPNAEIRVAQTEADFWLSEANAAKAPEGFKPFFEIARKSVAPYQAAGRFKPFSGEVDLGGDRLNLGDEASVGRDVARLFAVAVLVDVLHAPPCALASSANNASVRSASSGSILPMA